MFGTLVKKRDFYAGGLMTLLGAAVTLDSMTYSLGSLTHMGPGMFPLMLGVTLTVVGVLILGAAVATPLAQDNEKDRSGQDAAPAEPFLVFRQDVLIVAERGGHRRA